MYVCVDNKIKPTTNNGYEIHALYYAGSSPATVEK